jgi:uracil DNA glycosylase
VNTTQMEQYAATNAARLEAAASDTEISDAEFQDLQIRVGADALGELTNYARTAIELLNAVLTTNAEDAESLHAAIREFLS